MIDDYDEFGLFAENAAEAGLAWDGPPAVERVSVPVDRDRRLSALRWGTGDPEVVLLHGGAQNAHTWDTVLLALDRPALALDLPGHGHSDWRDDHAYSPANNAADIAVAVDALAPGAAMVVGMSLGGLTSFCLAASRPDLVARLAVVDVTPGTDHAKAEPIVTFISGPEVFASFDEILERTVEFNPTRSVSSLRRGILHNARERPDGRWEWRYDLPEQVPDDLVQFDPSELWDAIRDYPGRLFLARGGTSPVVDDDDVAELMRLRPDAHVEVFTDAGHSIQGDKPVELAEFLMSLPGS